MVAGGESAVCSIERGDFTAEANILQTFWIALYHLNSRRYTVASP